MIKRGASLSWREQIKKSFGKDPLICPQCGDEIIIPSWVVRDFSPGGKEYHPGGTSSLVYPICRGFIKIS